MMKTYELTNQERLVTGLAAHHDGTLLERARARLALYHRRARTRRELSWLTPAQLEDLGIDELTARSESAKPFWRA